MATKVVVGGIELPRPYPTLGSLTVPELSLVAGMMMLGCGMGYFMLRTRQLKIKKAALDSSLDVVCGNSAVASAVAQTIVDKVALLARLKTNKVAVTHGNWNNYYSVNEYRDVLLTVHATVLGVANNMHGNISPFRAQRINEIQLSKLPPRCLELLRRVEEKMISRQSIGDDARTLQQLLNEIEFREWAN